MPPAWMARTVESFASWITERSSIASQTASLTREGAACLALIGTSALSQSTRCMKPTAIAIAAAILALAGDRDARWRLPAGDCQPASRSRPFRRTTP